MLSGQVGMREDGTVPDDPIEQIDVALENVLHNLQAANMEVKDIIKLTYYLVGEIDTAKRRELVASKLQGHPAVRCYMSLLWRVLFIKSKLMH